TRCFSFGGFQADPADTGTCRRWSDTPVRVCAHSAHARLCVARRFGTGSEDTALEKRHHGHHGKTLPGRVSTKVP
ncbi:hypothetical protein HPB47_021243, partial [Ixodes persulcatus]